MILNRWIVDLFLCDTIQDRREPKRNFDVIHCYTWTLMILTVHSGRQCSWIFELLEVEWKLWRRWVTQFIPVRTMNLLKLWFVRWFVPVKTGITLGGYHGLFRWSNVVECLSWTWNPYHGIANFNEFEIGRVCFDFASADSGLGFFDFSNRHRWKCKQTTLVTWLKRLNFLSCYTSIHCAVHGALHVENSACTDTINSIFFLHVPRNVSTKKRLAGIEDRRGEFEMNHVLAAH